MAPIRSTKFGAKSDLCERNQAFLEYVLDYIYLVCQRWLKLAIHLLVMDFSFVAHGGFQIITPRAPLGIGSEHV